MTTIQISKLSKGESTPVQLIDRIPEVCISVRITQVDSFLHKLLPALNAAGLRTQIIGDRISFMNFIKDTYAGKKSGSAFIIKREFLGELNAGMHGIENVGKFATVYPKSLSQAIELSKVFDSLTINFHGPVIPGYYPVGNCIYWNSLPPKQVASPKQKRRNLTGKWIGGFVPTTLIREAPKGDIYKGIGFKISGLYEVFIKEGRPWVCEDEYGRDIRDRFIWQKTVVDQIGSHIPTPAVLKLINRNEASFLVFEHLDGVPLPLALNRLRNDRPWNKIPDVARMVILGYYLQILSIVEKIHGLGFIHRDLQDNNFIIRPNREVYICDFELAYSIDKGDPPYPMGTIGYASPNQMQGKLPTYEDDIFTLGALLYFFLLDIHPEALLRNKEVYLRKLETIQVDHLGNLVRRSLSEPQARPTLEELKSGIQHSLNALTMPNEP